MKKRKISERMKNVRSLTILFFIFTVVIWVALLLVKMVLFEFSAMDLFDDIVSNILGILPPIIIFNFVFEYFTQKYESDEISEKIADTIMGKSEIMNRFKTEQKIDFIKSTIATMVDSEAAEKFTLVISAFRLSIYTDSCISSITAFFHSSGPNSSRLFISFSSIMRFSWNMYS